MQKHFTLLTIFLISTFSLEAQDNYFQQEVNTRIEVYLNDSLHHITGNIEIEYINHSPDELQDIYIHLWANAYKNRSTAFAKQKVNQGNAKFYFAKRKDLGGYKNLDFHINGTKADWKYFDGKVDIAILSLDEPLKSGERLTITTPLHIKIPKSFSRFGHVGQSYQMTQWFPKPAVYDRKGWHPMSYVDMGEFYSEFGTYDVKITLPDNYVVGATGVLQNEEEHAFLLRKVEETNNFFAQYDDEALKAMKDSFPVSSTSMKTLHYKAERVHDFAWFADKRFHVQKGEVEMPSGRIVDTWAMFTNAEAWLWRKGNFYVNRAVRFYSDKVGEYPYPHATAVQSALSAGAGMEYPMITVIGLMDDPHSLDMVITHEVGHNWFYGILAFDEREHPWMDEGINSYYDHRYSTEYYGSSDMDFLPKFLTKGSDLRTMELAYLYQARRNLDQAPATHSEYYNMFNYFLGAYEKPAVCFKWLEKYLGTPHYDDIMQSFFEKWKFKHPLPEDLRSHFTKHSNKKVDWFFDGLIQTNDKTDYAFVKLKKDGADFTIVVKNKGQLSPPFPVYALKDSNVVHEVWYEGFEGKKELNFPKGEYDKLIIDKEHITLDLYRKNNQIRTKGLFPKMEPLQLKFLASVENPRRTQLFYTPLMAYNVYDRLMLGLSMYNISIPAKKFEFAFTPMYSFRTKNINGVGLLRYNIFPESDVLQQVTFALGAKQFSYNVNTAFDYHKTYTRLAPSVKIDFHTKFNKAFSHGVLLRTLFLKEQSADIVQVIDSTLIEDPDIYVYDTTKVFNGLNPERSRIYQISYYGRNTRAINPYHYRVGLEQQSYRIFDKKHQYLKASLELHTAYTYARNKKLDFRFFFGYFLQNTRRNAGSVNTSLARASFALTHQGATDYRYDYFHIGRNEQAGIWSQQVNIEEGGMKNAFGSAYSEGFSNDFIFAINFKADLPQALPFNIPLKPYFDIGYFQDKRPAVSGLSLVDQIWWSGGLMIDYKNIFSIHFPLFNSGNLKLLYKQRAENAYLARITWQLDLNKINPANLVNQFKI